MSPAHTLSSANVTMAGPTRQTGGGSQVSSMEHEVPMPFGNAGGGDGGMASVTAPGGGGRATPHLRYLVMGDGGAPPTSKGVGVPGPRHTPIHHHKPDPSPASYWTHSPAAGGGPSVEDDPWGWTRAAARAAVANAAAAATCGMTGPPPEPFWPLDGSAPPPVPNKGARWPTQAQKTPPATTREKRGKSQSVYPKAPATADGVRAERNASRSPEPQRPATTTEGRRPSASKGERSGERKTRPISVRKKRVKESEAKTSNINECCREAASPRAEKNAKRLESQPPAEEELPKEAEKIARQSQLPAVEKTTKEAEKSPKNQRPQQAEEERVPKEAEKKPKKRQPRPAAEKTRKVAEDSSEGCSEDGGEGGEQGFPSVPPRPSKHAVRGRVRYSREDTFTRSCSEEIVLFDDDADGGAVAGKKAHRRGNDAVASVSGEGLAGAGNSPGDVAQRLAGKVKGSRVREVTPQRPSTAFEQTTSKNLVQEGSAGGWGAADASPGVQTYDDEDPDRDIKEAFDAAAAVFEARERAKSATGDGRSSPGGRRSDEYHAPRASLMSPTSWKLHEGLAWELWYEQKLKEETARRRKEQRRRRLEREQEEARKQDEERKRLLEEENRQKWLERKRKQEEEEKKKVERQKKAAAERKEQEEAVRREVRSKICEEYGRKTKERAEEIKKAEAQQRAQQEKLREEAEQRRRELKERSLQQWKVRAARHAKPLTGSIFQREGQPRAPKPALDFYNPEPWQF